MSIIICVALLLSMGSSYADLRITSKEEMQKQAQKGEEIKNRKLYHTFKGTYVPNTKDEQLLKKVNKKLEKINSKKPDTFKKIYKLI